MVAVAAILELHRPSGSGCGDVSLMGLQTAAALYWAVGKLNDQPLIDGLRLGETLIIPPVVWLVGRLVGWLIGWLVE